MGLFDKLSDKLRNEFIDIIEWKDDTHDTMVWRFPRYQSEIKNGAQLTVREGQVAILVDEGKLADIFQPGRYEYLPVPGDLPEHAFPGLPAGCSAHFLRVRKATGSRCETRADYRVQAFLRRGQAQIQAQEG